MKPSLISLDCAINHKRKTSFPTRPAPLFGELLRLLDVVETSFTEKPATEPPVAHVLKRPGLVRSPSAGEVSLLDLELITLIS